MSDSKINTLTPTAAPSGTEITPIGSVTTMVGADTVKVPMSTLRNADGTDAMANIAGMASSNAAISAATGAPSDAAWSGTGNSTLIAALKAIWAKLGTALNIRPLNGSTDSISVINLPATQTVTGNVGISNFPATQAVSATALPLPNGAATDASLTAIKTALGTPLQAGGRVIVDSLPLANGAATSAGQDAIVAALGTPLPLATGAASDAAINTLNTSIATLTKHIAINNILLSEMTDKGRTDLRSLLNEQGVTNY